MMPKGCFEQLDSWADHLRRMLCSPRHVVRYNRVNECQGFIFEIDEIRSRVDAAAAQRLLLRLREWWESLD